jgi:glutamate racemase
MACFRQLFTPLAILEVMKLGVFDSGIGGEAVAASLRDYFPNAEIIVVNDKANVPYGDKTSLEIINLTDAAIQPILMAPCKVIIIACNTATALAIDTLRSRYPNQLFIGIEPMLKPAALLTKSGVIGVCATPATVTSTRYKQLRSTYANALEIIEPDCRTWARMIEDNTLNHLEITQTINELCEKGADVIVLGCTHYHWIKKLISDIAEGRAVILEPSEAIGRRVAGLLD